MLSYGAVVGSILVARIYHSDCGSFGGRWTETDGVIQASQGGRLVEADQIQTKIIYDFQEANCRLGAARALH